MKARDIPVLPVLLMLALLLLAWWVYTRVEFVDREFPVSQSQEARRNYLLAAQRLLESRDFTVRKAENVRDISRLSSSDTGLLWIHDISVIQTLEQQQVIVDWVNRGGSLIAGIIEYPYYGEDLPVQQLLDELGVNADVNRIDEKEIQLRVEDAGQDGDEELPKTVATYKVILPDEPAITLQFTDFYDDVVELSNNTHVQNIINSSHVFHNALGAGYATVYDDHEMFDNDQINNADAGYLLLWLTEPVKNKNAMLVLNLDDAPGLFGTLWNRFPMMLILLAVVIAGFLRLAASRWGPIEQEPVAGGSNILSHLKARAEFWQRHRKTNSLLDPVREAALQRIAGTRAHSVIPTVHDDNSIHANVQRGLRTQLSDADSARLARQAARMSGTDANTAQHVLFNDMKSDRELIQAARFFHTLLHKKNRLGSHNDKSPSS